MKAVDYPRDCACGEGCLDAARGLAFGLVSGLAAWGVIAAAAAALV